MLLSCTGKSVSGEVVLVGSDALRRAHLASITLRSSSSSSPAIIFNLDGGPSTTDSSAGAGRAGGRRRVEKLSVGSTSSVRLHLSLRRIHLIYNHHFY
jgi:hypothetical protein